MSRRTADAIASEPCGFFVLRRSGFLAHLEKDARVAVRVIELLCQRIRWVSDRMEETVLLPFQVRLARRLAVLVEHFGMEIHISQDRLANYVGVARETVNRQLQIRRRDGLLDLRRGRILDRDMLMRETVFE